jgi:hypothetical protein
MKCIITLSPSVAVKVGPGIVPFAMWYLVLSVYIHGLLVAVIVLVFVLHYCY